MRTKIGIVTHQLRLETHKTVREKSQSIESATTNVAKVELTGGTSWLHRMIGNTYHDGKISFNNELRTMN
ncbi:MAG: hypothetical protein ACTS80_01300 [Candidatus Hodgkinia cicadicola]